MEETFTSDYSESRAVSWTTTYQQRPTCTSATSTHDMTGAATQTAHNCSCQNCVKFPTTLIIVGTKRTEIMRRALTMHVVYSSSFGTQSTSIIQLRMDGVLHAAICI